MNRSGEGSASLIDYLKQWFVEARRIVIVGVGNPIRRDDNTGVGIVSDLEGEVPESVLLVKSETVPEEYAKPIIDFKPTHILIIDATLLNISPGSARLVKSMKTSRSVVSTHFLPIQIFCEYLTGMTGARSPCSLFSRDTLLGIHFSQKANRSSPPSRYSDSRLPSKRGKYNTRSLGSSLPMHRTISSFLSKSEWIQLDIAEVPPPHEDCPSQGPS